MNKNLRSILVYATAMSVSLSACKDNTEEEISESAENQTASTEVEIPDSFSAFTVEKNKINLEDNGIALAKDLESFQHAKGVSSLSNLSTLMLSSDEGARHKEVLSLIQIFKSYHEGKVSSQRALKSMRSTEEDMPEDLGAALTTYGGVYEWDDKAQMLNQVEQAADKMVIKFPSTVAGTSNNAVLHIHSYEGVVVKNAAAEIDAELPTQLKMELTVDNSKEIEYSLAAAYNDKGEPTKAAIMWKINPFKLTSVFENETEEIGFSYAFTKNNKNLISFGAGSQGNFDTEFMAKTFEEDDENVGAVFHNARAYFQLSNIKFAGKINIKDLLAESTENGDNEMEDYSVEKEADLLNKNTTFVVYYADSKEKIADTEFYVTKHTDEYEDYDYNEETQEWDMVTKTETYETVAPRLIFADGSKSDLETYVSDGFSNLEKELEKLAEMLENFM